MNGTLLIPRARLVYFSTPEIRTPRWPRGLLSCFVFLHSHTHKHTNFNLECWRWPKVSWPSIFEMDVEHWRCVWIATLWYSVVGMIPDSLEVYMKVNWSWLPPHLTMWLLLLLSSPFVKRVHRRDRQYVWDSICTLWNQDTSLGIHPTPLKHVHTTLWNEDTSLIGTLQVPTPLKPVHTTPSNEDTSLIGTNLQVPTPLKPVHTTLWNELDTSLIRGTSSGEACTYYPWNEVTSTLSSLAIHVTTCTCTYFACSPKCKSRPTLFFGKKIFPTSIWKWNAVNETRESTCP